MGIEVSNVSKIFGDPPVKALSQVSLQVEDGDFVALTGKSGSGKSTLLYLMSTLDFATSGTIKISGRDVRNFSSRELSLFRNQHMGFVFQFHYLIAELTALENVLLPTHKQHNSGNYTEKAKDLLARFGLKDLFHRLPHHLSGGEQQRVAIARALIMDPEYLFTDEPTGSLDTVSGKVVMDILRDINLTNRTTIVLVTHDKDYAARAKSRVLLQDGKILGTEDENQSPS